MLSVFTIATGLVILSGAIASTKFRRVMEAAILKVLGATKKTILLMLSYEYVGLGLITGVVGSFLSVLLSYGISKYLIRLEWIFRPVPIILGIAITTVLVCFVGLLSSWNILKIKPLQILRKDA